MVFLSKRMKHCYQLVEETKAYSIEEAIDQLTKIPKVKFDETVQIHFHLNVDPKNSDQMVRGTMILPHGAGKKFRIAVFCKGELIQRAKAAGADIVGGEDLMNQVAKGFMDFDCVIASPDMMRELSKLGKILGPRGLMPSPKTGTVTMDIEKAIEEVKAGKIEFKTDKQGGIHVGIGKRSFPKEHLLENVRHLSQSIIHAKPHSLKGDYIKSLFISTTMGPGIRIAL